MTIQGLLGKPEWASLAVTRLTPLYRLSELSASHAGNDGSLPAAACHQLVLWNRFEFEAAHRLTQPA